MINLLIVDDEELNLRIIEESLEDGGYILTKAIDGNQAWDILKTKKTDFAAIILDRLMPNLDGIEVLKYIKSDRDLRDIPVILQTALSANKEIVDGIESGAFYYLTKPYSKRLLVSVVNSAVDNFYRLKKAKDELSISKKVMRYLSEGIFFLKDFNDVLEFSPVIANSYPEPNRVLTGIMELLNNSIEHGNLELGYELKKKFQLEDSYIEEIEKRKKDIKYSNRQVKVKYEKRENSIHLWIQDEGLGFDFSKYQKIENITKNLFHSSGRGILISSTISFDQLIYHGSGNLVEAVYYISQANTKSSNT
jgi:CheY-like chemotaxis protein/anti-sigma regulatory factor (Ser/Thr protein kinase)